MDPIAIGVLGLGKMGLHHVRCAQQARGLTLVGASDVDPSRANELPEGARFIADPAELMAAADAVVLAVPTDRHASVGRRILEAGCHLLVEKPLATTVAECDELAEVAAAGHRVLRVGHVERWNAAYRGVKERIRLPRFVEGHRLAAFNPRGTEVDVVLDLMIHDLDLVLDIYRAEPVRVEAVGVAVLTDRIDIANARLEFPGGELVNLTASRASREPVRKLRLFQDDTYLSLDFQTQCAEVFSRNAGSPWGVSQLKQDPPAEHNPLVAELEGFAAAIRGEASPIATAEDGRRAVALAERIRESMRARTERWSAAVGDAPWPSEPS